MSSVYLLTLGQLSGRWLILILSLLYSMRVLFSDMNFNWRT
jgi:hypothetical protein